MTPVVAALRERVSGAVLEAEPLAGYTTLKVGGPAAALVRAEREEDLAAVAQICSEHGIDWLVIGRGSNLLVADRGWDGVVVTLGKGFRGVIAAPDAREDIGTDVEVDAGAAEPMPVLANAVAGLGLGGVEFGVAIPGSLGGAVRMNAGAHGREMSDILIDARVVSLSTGAASTIAAEALHMTYRHTDLPAEAVVVRARLRLQRAAPDELAAAMAEMRQWRRDHQPINVPSCGSVFRNPPGESAGRLIEAAGMKGHRVGGAQVSEVHANFITVAPGSRASDVAAVILAVTDAVRRHSGITLQTEVVLAGFDQPAPDKGT